MKNDKVFNDGGKRIPEKLMFFFGCICFYSSHVFTLNNMAIDFKLNYLGLGFVTGMVLFNFIGSYVFSMYNDRTKKPKKTIYISIFFYTLIFSLFLANKILKSKLDMENSLRKFLHDPKNSAIIFGLIFSLSQFFSSAIYPTMDTIGLAMTRRFGAEKETFGRQRMWGIVGHTFTSIIIEHLMGYFDHENKENLKDYFYYRFCSTKEFPIYKNDTFLVSLNSFFNVVAHVLTLVLDCTLVIPLFAWILFRISKESKEYVPLGLLIVSGSIFCLVVFLFIPDDVLEYSEVKEKKNKNEINKKEIKEALKKVFSNSDVYFFFFVLICAGYVRSVLTYYLVFYTEAVKHLTTKIGETNKQKPFTIFALAKGISEFFCYFFEKKLISLFGSSKNLILIGNLLGLIRLILYVPIGYKNVISIGFFIELLKGLNSGFLLTGSIRYIRETFPPCLTAVGQGFLNGTYNGLSSLVGGLSTGLLMNAFIKNKTSFSRYTVLNNVNKKIEIDAEIHYNSFNNVFLVTFFISGAGVLIYMLESLFVRKITNRTKELNKNL